MPFLLEITSDDYEKLSWIAATRGPINEFDAMGEARRAVDEHIERHRQVIDAAAVKVEADRRECILQDEASYRAGVEAGKAFKPGNA